MNLQVSLPCNELPARPEFGQAKVEGYLKSALSPNTWKAYRDDLKHFLAWGGALPSSPEQIAAYLADHATTHAVSTLIRRVSSLSKAHRLYQHPNPTDSELIRATLRGIRNTHGSHQRQVAPAIKEDVLAMVNGLTGTKGVRDKALLLVGFAGAFRRSELVALAVSDVETVKQGLVVHLRRSKTDQAGEGRKVAIPYARGKVCPVLALQEWLTVSGVTDGPLFRGVNKGGAVSEAALSAQSVALIVKERAAAVGLDATQYSGHSLRAGLVTSAAQAGVSSWKIRQQTGHRSDEMLMRYIRDANIFVDNAAGGVL